jgi:hypothetical protein
VRLSQQERLELKLRQARASGDVVTVARIQAKVAERALAQAERDQRRRPQRINLKDPGAPSHDRARHTSLYPAPVAAASLSAIATFPPEEPVEEVGQ